MRVLVTGASGFIGGHVAHYLASEHEVVVDLNTSMRVDVIVHAAAASPQPGVGPIEIIRGGVFTTTQLIGTIDCDKIIFCSSLSLHGRVVGPRVHENTPVVDPDVYGASKLLCERIFAESEIPTVALRLPGVLGRGAHRCWLSRVAEKLQSDETVTVHHPHSWFNNAVYVRDLARFVGYLVEKPWTGFHAMPLGADSYMEPLTIVKKLKETLGSSSKIALSSQSLPFHFNISNRLAKKWGYDPLPLDHMLTLYALDLLEAA